MPSDSILTFGHLGGAYRLSGIPQTASRESMTPTARLGRLVASRLAEISNAERMLGQLETVNGALAESVAALREGLKQVRQNCKFLNERRFSHIVENPSISRHMMRQIERYLQTTNDLATAIAKTIATHNMHPGVTQAAAKKCHNAIVALETTIRSCAPDQKKKLKDKIAGGIAIPWVLAYQIVSAYAMQARDRHAKDNVISTDDDWIVQLAWSNAVPAVLSIVATLDYLFTPDDCTMYLRTALVGLANETRHLRGVDVFGKDPSAFNGQSGT